MQIPNDIASATSIPSENSQEQGVAPPPDPKSHPSELECRLRRQNYNTYIPPGPTPKVYQANRRGALSGEPANASSSHRPAMRGK